VLWNPPVTLLHQRQGDPDQLLKPRGQWGRLEDWIRLNGCRGTKFPALEDDLLFRGPRDPALLGPFPAVIICPGGDYRFLAPYEAYPVAHKFCQAGYVAYVLRYRLVGCGHAFPAQLHDLTVALSMVRSNPDVDGGKVVLCGFSAGGHLAGAAARLPKRIRPAASVLVYPAVDCEGWAEESGQGQPSTDWSLHLPQCIDSAAPATFVVASHGDSVCPPAKHSDLLVKALRKNGTPVSYVVGNHGEHGFGIADWWFRPCRFWLQAMWREMEGVDSVEKLERPPQQHRSIKSKTASPGKPMSKTFPPFPAASTAPVNVVRRPLVELS